MAVNVTIDESNVLDTNFFLLKMRGIWNIEVQTKSAVYSMFSNDADPSNWCGQSRSQDDKNWRTFWDIRSASCWSNLGFFEKDGCSTPMDMLKNTNSFKEDSKIVSVSIINQNRRLSTLLTYGVTVGVKKKLTKLSFKSKADNLIRQQINKTLENFGEDYEVSDFDLVNSLVKKTLENIKAAKKAAKG